eukprot:366413-Chlamydomonas_euryale.AAC.14
MLHILGNSNPARVGWFQSTTFGYFQSCVRGVVPIHHILGNSNPACVGWFQSTTFWILPILRAWGGSNLHSWVEKGVTHRASPELVKGSLLGPLLRWGGSGWGRGERGKRGMGQGQTAEGLSARRPAFLPDVQRCSLAPPPSCTALRPLPPALLPAPILLVVGACLPVHAVMHKP